MYFSGCGALTPEGIITAVDNSILPKFVTLFLFQISNLCILDTHIYGSKGAGMLAVNPFDFILNRTSFVGNVPNCDFMFMDESNPPDKLHVTGYITRSEFAYGRSNSSNYGGGLSLLFIQTSHTVNVKIIDVALYNNTGTFWGNFLVSIAKLSCKCTMVQAEKVRSSNHLRHIGQLFTVEGISYNPVRPPQGNHSVQFEYTVHIVDSCFDRGTGTTAVDIGSVYQESQNLRVKFTNVSILCHQKDEIYIGMYVSNVLSIELERIKVICNANTSASIAVTNSTITIQDTFILESKGIYGTVLVTKSQVTFLGDTVFFSNYATGAGAINAQSSTLIFQGNVELVNNIGYDGGAMALSAGSQIVIEKHTHLTFSGNHAEHFGGAIYVDKVNYLLISDGITVSCFCKVAGPFISSMNPHVVFENNTAKYAGSALYGGWIDFCGKDDQRTPDFDILFKFNGRESDSSVIASNPLRVCLCIDSRPECSITQHNISVYPGTTIHIPVVAVGQRFGTVPSTIHSEFLNRLTKGFCPNIEDWQHTQKVGKDCTNLTYTIMSPSQVKLTMTVEVESLNTPGVGELLQAAGQLNKLIDLDKYFTNLLIYIRTLSCPLGFEYNNRLMICTCDSKLDEYGLNCSINTQTIWRKNPFWITTAEESGGVLVHEHCPFDYCKPDSFDLDLEDSDEQCAFHRSGILCGACQYNLSHVFGTSACRECSSLWALLWVPAIALAGIALVVLLIVLNLTVSVGTINGLIFYADIVRANHATFFPPNTTNSFLSWFIAWTNLDLGIETCFYSGLDAYVKTWLQFVFPLYIWLIVVLIIVFSRYFNKVARLSGRNAVPVLATLFLLSYAKLLRIIITVFQSTQLEYPANTVRKVWHYDGNVDYLKGKHIPLFIAALLLLLISLPYTAVLIFILHLQQKSNYRSRMLFWVQKLKPLFDAYTGPYKGRHRYWTGLLLLVRIVLFIVFSMNIRASPNINLLAIIVTVLLLFVLLAAARGVYKTWYLNIIEYSFFLNLGILASATLYTSTVTGQGQTAVVYTSVSFAFALFIVIIVLHILTKLNSSQHCKGARKLGVKLSKLTSAIRKHCCKQRRPHYNTPEPRVTHTADDLRESLLEYCSQ